MTVTDPAVLDPKAPAGRPARRDAVGAEIPVTVHASRSTQGPGKNLPSVHEDTKTVIVLQQGAVVRLTASLMTGETVVLTNRMTGADVLCRVANVKSQSGIQHYVDLEFIQRAPSFWGDTGAASSAPIANETLPSAPVTPAPTLASQAPVRVAAPVAPIPVAAMPPAPSVMPPPPVRVPVAASVPVRPMAVAPPPSPVTLVPEPAPIASPAIVAVAPTAPLLPAPAPQLHKVAAEESIQAAPLAEPVAAAPKVSAPSLPVSHDFADDSSFGSINVSGSRTSGSNKALMAIAAAALLVLGGGAGGYWFYSHQPSAAGQPVTQQTVSVPSAPSLTDTPLMPASAPISESSQIAQSVSSTPHSMDVIVDPRLSEDASASRVPAPPVSAPRATVTPPAPRRASLPIGQLQAPKAKVARITSNEPPPVMVGAVNLGDAASTGLLAAAPSGPAPPPAIGGQLQQPQLVTSTPPAYPATARMQHVEGTVALDALVDETGKVVETKVIAGPAPLLAAAQDAVRTWRYKPAQLNGRPIAVHTKVTVRFALH